MHRLDLHRQVVFELGAVGDVQVDIDQRIPGADHGQHGLHFRRVGLGVVAVQVEILGGRAPAHFDRAALVRAVPFLEALVAVDIEYGNENQDLLFQRAGRSLVVEDLAQRQKARVLAVNFAGMDAALHQHHRQAALPGRLRREGAAARDHQRLHRPPLRRAPELDAFDRRGVGCLELRAQGDDFIVASRCHETGAFGQCGDGGGGKGGRYGAQQGKQQRRTDHR